MRNSFELPREYNERPEDNERHLGDLHIAQAYRKALAVPRDPIDLEGFRKQYGNENVDRDLATVARLEKKFGVNPMDREAVRHAQIGKIFEVIIFQQIELANWFGEVAQTIATSRFDDLVNGIDVLVEIDERKSKYHLGLAIDTTTSIMKNREKFGRIQDEINTDRLAEVAYFKTDNSVFEGKMKDVPRVVIGADGKTVDNLITVWMKNDTKALAAHPIQIKILSEIRTQLACFKEYCDKTNHHRLAEIYDNGLRIVDDILAQKKILLTPEVLAELEKDQVYQSIVMSAGNVVASVR